MYQAGKVYQVPKEIRKCSSAILGVSKTRWTCPFDNCRSEMIWQMIMHHTTESALILSEEAWKGLKELEPISKLN